MEADFFYEGTENNRRFSRRPDSLSEFHLANYAYFLLPFVVLLLVAEGLKRVLFRYLVLCEIQVADWHNQKSTP